MVGGAGVFNGRDHLKIGIAAEIVCSTIHLLKACAANSGEEGTIVEGVLLHNGDAGRSRDLFQRRTTVEGALADDLNTVQDHRPREW